ncbi:hypothetical protein BGZ65_008566 [Modicella reniformis]|uniref:PhoD-like phosphatase domain-containing protein n=1 Tax=Modicella reniformis TaxID=1440133 RepID=A0A9P6MF67_9FUNG|nr:hypothetical protein BGZ65_008566 [Modicella reniformis]
MPSYSYGQQQHHPYPPTSPPLPQPLFQHPQLGGAFSASPFKCGPLLRFQNLDNNQGLWIGSVLVVSNPETFGQPPPVLTWSDGRSSSPPITAENIDMYRQSVFWRFPLVIPQDPYGTKKITYSINNGQSYGFFVAGVPETFRWMFFSCNGFSSAVDSVAMGGPNPLWNDMMAKHAANPYHVMIGGGDQLYCDSLLNEPEMMEWLGLGTTEERERVNCGERWTTSIEQYYFNRYSLWFSRGTYGQALAAIPSINMWDDHDTIDGYGAYPESMQKSSTFAKIGETSRRFYLLFQHHTTHNLAQSHGLFSSGVGYNILASLGPKISILALDARSERTKYMVCSDATYNWAFDMMRGIPPGTGHLLVLLGVPIAYPRLVFAENLMGSVGSVLGSISGAAKVVNKLNGEPELLDDLNDHWTAKSHKPERKIFLTRLQNFANERRIRVTFISGDVHCAGVGRFSAKISPPERDPQLMYQIISSAIVNEPPPEGVIRLLHFQDKVHILDGRVKTYEDMHPMFANDVDGKPLQMDKLLPRRNYSHGFFNASTGGLEISIFAENVRGGPENAPGGDRGTVPYSIHVPRLEL